MKLVQKLWDMNRKRLVTMRAMDFLFDFGIVRSALLLIAPIMFVILWTISDNLSGSLIISAISCFPLFFVLEILLAYMSIFECIARSMLGLLVREG